MAQEYTIEKISEQEPRKWDGPHGIVYYIKVKLKDVDKPVSIGKKKPDALKAGMTVYGTIEESDLPEDKFKAEKAPDGSYGGQKQDGRDNDYWDKKDRQIRAQWAIGQAVQLHIAVTAKGGEEAQSIVDTAKQLFAMVERVVTDTKEDEVVDFDPNDTDIVNLNDIPF